MTDPPKPARPCSLFARLAVAARQETLVGQLETATRTDERVQILRDLVRIKAVLDFLNDAEPKEK